ncbi:hypothetical protein FRC04_010612 [Tulasnella sp. 424]|nr:hypothetical protein FRC04_010612 [Tulasnella sp. 424]KAG8972433.1 hypothetical protein FRC05_010026 [Tulasnella sp. 425]
MFLDRIELYAPAERAWHDSLIVPEDIPMTAPQWTFRYKPMIPISLGQNVSRLIYDRSRSSAMFSIHNNESIINVQISLHEGSIPDVWVAHLEQMDQTDFMSVGMGRAIRNTRRKKEAVFITFGQKSTLSSLRSFAGIIAKPLNPVDPCLIAESKFHAFLPSNSGAWELDEWSGRIRCDLDDAPETGLGRRVRFILYLAH